MVEGFVDYVSEVQQCTNSTLNFTCQWVPIVARTNKLSASIAQLSIYKFKVSPETACVADFVRIYIWYYEKKQAKSEYSGTLKP